MISKPVADTSFAEAGTSFREFLDENGETEPILWTFVEDVCSRNTNHHETKFWVKLPIPQENENFAEICFKLAKRRNLGVALVAYARCEYGLCCAIIMPADEEDAQYSMMTPTAIRYSIVQDMPTAIAVKRSFRWFLMNLAFFKYCRGNYIVYLKSKSDLS